MPRQPELQTVILGEGRKQLVRSRVRCALLLGLGRLKRVAQGARQSDLRGQDPSKEEEHFPYLLSLGASAG